MPLPLCKYKLVPSFNIFFTESKNVGPPKTKF